jgi:hypothetical protein
MKRPFSPLQKLKIYKLKRREGVLERYVDGYSAVGKGLFKKETDISQFVGLRVRTEAGEEGTIQSSFGKSGKFKVSVRMNRLSLPLEAPTSESGEFCSLLKIWERAL